MTMVLGALLASHPVAAQVTGQSFQVIPETAGAAVGDSVTIRFRVRLDERDLLFDTIPQPIGALPAGVRVLSVEKLSRTPDRIFHGRALIAFYRPGKQPIPVFGLPFMRAVKGVQRATLASDSAFVDVRSLLPAGNPALKDIKALERRPAPGLLPLGFALALLLAATLYSTSRRRRRPPPALPEPEPIAPPADRSPYEVALERLAQVEGEHWWADGNVDLYYETVVNVLRQYLEDAEGIGALERTTSELLWALPPHLSADGLRGQCDDVLSEADLVKFATLRPYEAEARAFLDRARRLLDAWHAAAARPEASIDAVR